MAVSQKQIAEKVGVSIALVSRVLSGTASDIGIRPATIEQVLRAAEEMGYVPSAAALTLKGKSTRTIGVAVYDFNDPFFGALIEQIQIQAHEHNYSLVLSGFIGRFPDAQDLLALHKHAIEGLIVLGSDTDAGWLDDFRQMPVARIGHGTEQEESVRISINEEDAARQLAKHLEGRGIGRAVCISCPLPAHQLRRDALERALVSEGIKVDSASPARQDPFTAGLHGARGLLEQGLNADALVCTSDQIAMGALHALSDGGVDIPGQVAVTGFDDIPFAAQFIPPLTTIQQPVAAMVEAAFQNILEPCDSRTLSFDGSLVVRRTA